MHLVKVILKPEVTTSLKDVLFGLGFHGITVKPSIGDAY